MKAWKNAEKEVANFFKGTRRIRIRYDEKIGDVVHPLYSIEVKYGKQIPMYLDVRIPTLLTVGDEKYRVIPSGWVEVDEQGLMGYNVMWWQKKRRKTATFLTDAIAQATRYNPNLQPIVCVKPNGRHGFVIIWCVNKL